MPGAFDQFLSQVAEFWRGLSGAQRVALFSTVLITTGALVLVLSLGGRSDYGTLYANLSAEDAGRIVDELATMQVPFRLTHAGTVVQVPLERVYDLRLELAQRGLSTSGTVGLEVFDDAPLGMTPFQQRVRFRRALEGELARTIASLAPVNWARVHINLPDKQVFRRGDNAATASVVVSLAPGRELSASEARGISQLIAGAVDELASSHVSILDASGRLLLRPQGNEEEALAAEALDVQRNIERELANRAQRMLDAALGSDKGIVTVSAQIDMRRVEEKQDRVNPDESTVVSEQRSEESRSESSTGAGGVPGVASNVPPGEGGALASAPSTETVTRETINYDFTRSTSRTVVPMGAVQRLSVALLVDGTYTTPEAQEGEPPPAPVYAPRSAEEMQQLGEIVKRAVGFDAERGDVIEVQNFAFRSPLEDLPEPVAPGLWERPEFLLLLTPIARGVAVLGAIALLIFLVIRPTLRQLSTAAATNASSAAAPAALPAGAQPGAVESGELAIPVSKDDARVVAEAIRQWLRE